MTIHSMRSEHVWKKAAMFLLTTLKDASRGKKKVLLFLSGGSVVRLYETLGQVLRKGEIDPSQLAFAQADERFQPYESQKSKIDLNAVSIRRTGLWKVCKAKNIPYYLISQEGMLEDSARQYNETISKLLSEYPYRLAILGIGEDGHTAGLIPGHEEDWNVDRYVVGYNLGQEKSRDFSCQHKFRERITVTPKLLEKLDYALFVAVGEKKRSVLEKLVEQKISQDFDSFPALLLHQLPQVTIFTDNSIKVEK